VIGQLTVGVSTLSPAEFLSSSWSGTAPVPTAGSSSNQELSTPRVNWLSPRDPTAPAPGQGPENARARTRSECSPGRVHHQDPQGRRGTSRGPNPVRRFPAPRRQAILGGCKLPALRLRAAPPAGADRCWDRGWSRFSQAQFAELAVVSGNRSSRMPPAVPDH